MSFASDENPVPVVDTLRKIVNLATTCIGLIVVIVGLKYAIDVFQLIFSMLKAPDVLTGPIRQLATSFGGTAFDLKLPDRTIPLSNIIALIIYCCGVAVGAFLTMALMQTGAKIVALTTGDRSAVRQILQSAFGRRQRPEPMPEERRPQSRG